MNTTKVYYKAYYMITSRCNLACSYCVLENRPYQLEQEISLDEKMKLIAHLYNNLNFRSLTLSGGEAMIIGKNAPSDFLVLLNFLKQFKSLDPEKNLQIYLYTNGLLIDQSLVSAMEGVVDEVSINIDSIDHEILRKIGRNRKTEDDYFFKIVSVCQLLSERRMAIKLHSVISQYNYQTISLESKLIYKAMKDKGVVIKQWKLYQYMSYDVPVVDSNHQLSSDQYVFACKQVTDALQDCEVSLHFKDNREMNESLFNILPYGNVQYMIPGDTWKSSRRTDNLLKYATMNDFFQKNNISEYFFNQYHTFKPTKLDANR